MVGRWIFLLGCPVFRGFFVSFREGKRSHLICLKDISRKSHYPVPPKFQSLPDRISSETTWQSWTGKFGRSRCSSWLVIPDPMVFSQFCWQEMIEVPETWKKGQFHNVRAKNTWGLSMTLLSRVILIQDPGPTWALHCTQIRSSIFCQCSW